MDEDEQGELMMIFTKRPKTWNEYIKKVDDTNLSVGHRPTERLKFLNITEETLEEVREAAQYLRPFKEEMVNKFYENITSSEHLQDIISKYASVDQLKITQIKYIEQFLQANIDHDYVKTRVTIGEVHSRINLTANHFIMAHDMLIQFMTTILMEKVSKNPNKMISLVVAIQKLGTFDKQLIVDVYTESTFRSFLFGISDMLDNLTKLDTTQHLIEGMEEQITESQSVTAATEQMSASIQDVSNHAVKVAEGTEEAVLSALNSRKVIDHALNDIEQVGKVYDSVMKEVHHLGNEIEQTHVVINVIKEIAEQTNLLALNASIEAARAGEYGQGFAVVATEVRKLSEHTKEQIEQITKNMENLQHVSKNVTERIQETGTSIEKGVAESQQAGKELENIISTMQRINGETSQIAAMSEEQSSTVVEINERNIKMFEVSKHTQKVATETAEIIYDLSKKMNEYRLTFIESNLIYNQKDIIQLAKTDHLLWKWNIYNLLLGFGSVSANQLTSHKVCRLGKWYYSDQSISVKNNEAFKKLEAPHKAVHAYAKDAIEHYERENIDKAKSALVRLEEASNEVMELLVELEKAF